MDKKVIELLNDQINTNVKTINNTFFIVTTPRIYLELL